MRKSGLLIGMAIGAGMTYLLDPDAGARRRARLRARIEEQLLGEEGAREPVEVPVRRYGSRRGDIPGLESATLESRGPHGTGARPATLLGGALTVYGVVRRGPLGFAARTLGAGMLWNELSQPTEPAAPAAGERRRTVDIQKTLLIDAPPDRVYGFWTDYENFPLFMSNVREVRDLGGGRSYWVVRGPGGVPIEWQAVLTEQVPGEILAWRSRPGSMLENAGAVRFRAEGEGTRVDLRLCYSPPAGGAGQAVMELLGADPRAKLNEDLGRLKALLEGTNRSEAHGRESEQ